MSKRNYLYCRATAELFFFSAYLNAYQCVYYNNVRTKFFDWRNHKMDFNSNANYSVCLLLFFLSFFLVWLTSFVLNLIELWKLKHSSYLWFGTTNSLKSSFLYLLLFFFFWNLFLSCCSWNVENMRKKMCPRQIQCII